MVKMKIVMMVELVLHAPPLITDQIMMMMKMMMVVDPILNQIFDAPPLLTDQITSFFT